MIEEIASLERMIASSKEALDECDDREDRQSIRDSIERMRARLDVLSRKKEV